ncbi:cytochrome P450 [Hymenopellis radicata]|nr:cytochrome P450 [Hymenopellis radicata]
MTNLIGDTLQQLSYLQLFFLLVVARFAYLLVYRLYLHPLKSFPGPRFAAVTDYYQAYFEVWKNGMFVQHLEELHEFYGPVVRIRPNELHFNTAEAFSAIYPSYTGFTKDPDFYTCFGEDDSAFGMTNVHDHKIRREILNPLFSRRAILKLESFVQEKVDLFAEQIHKHQTAPVNLFRGFRSLAMDVVTEYSYAHSFGGLTTPGFDHPILRAVEGDGPAYCGTDTSSNAMTIGFFHLLANESVKKTLQAELREAWPEKDTPFSYEMAEKLPYLTGVIKEALRLSSGVPVSLPASSRPRLSLTDIRFLLSVVGVAQPFVLKNPDILPRPAGVQTERWIGADAQNWTILAWCELYLAFAHLMRKFDMQLFETSLEDMVFRDHMVPVWTTRPLQAIVTEQVE